MTLLHPSKVSHLHPVALNQGPLNVDVDLSIFVDSPDGVDQLGAFGDDLVADFWSSWLHGGILGGSHVEVKP
jgi:hypothetical protein